MTLKQLTLLLFGGCSLAIQAQSPYISRVFAYQPAPGQFINENYPKVLPGDTYSEVLARVDSLLTSPTGQGRNFVTLGAWGGSITFGFDHDIANLDGQPDFIVFGNAFNSGQPQDGLQFGSFEPGIIYVAEDANGNGLPDDPWYEIAGSEFAQTNRQYRCTYTYSTGDILWEDNEGQTGSIRRNAFHKQESYFPQWLDQSTYTLEGSILPPNILEDKRAFSYAWGYADNQPNDSTSAQIDISWAVDANGQPAHLQAIRFVKVQTGVQVDWGISGEMSTEVSGAQDLHLDATALPPIDATTENPRASKLIRHGQLYILRNGHLYDALGHLVQ